MTPLMLTGMILSFIGVGLILGIVFYYTFLPINDPFRIFLDTSYLGLTYLLYVIIIGAAISGVGLLIYIRAVRTGITIPAGEYSYTRPASIIRRPAPKKEILKPPIEKTAIPTKPRGENIVEEIEKEIEQIIETVEKPVEEKAVEEKKPMIEVISRATDMVCPHCGKLNPVGSIKCEACGKQMFTPETPSKSCPVCNAPLTLSQKISGDLYVCGICFSEIRIPPEIQKLINIK